VPATAVVGSQTFPTLETFFQRVGSNGSAAPPPAPAIAPPAHAIAPTLLGTWPKAAVAPPPPPCCVELELVDAGHVGVRTRYHKRLYTVLRTVNGNSYGPLARRPPSYFC
jgi:hypothetical protein